MNKRGVWVTFSDGWAVAMELRGFGASLVELAMLPDDLFESWNPDFCEFSRDFFMATKDAFEECGRESVWVDSSSICSMRSDAKLTHALGMLTDGVQS